jgi:hypothetical protein
LTACLSGLKYQVLEAVTPLMAWFGAAATEYVEGLKEAEVLPIVCACQLITTANTASHSYTAWQLYHIQSMLMISVYLQ